MCPFTRPVQFGTVAIFGQGLGKFGTNAIFTEARGKLCHFTEAVGKFGHSMIMPDGQHCNLEKGGEAK